MVVEKSGRIDTVILSAEQYQALKSQHDLTSRAARKKAFETELGEWIAAQYEVSTNPSRRATCSTARPHG